MAGRPKVSLDFSGDGESARVVFSVPGIADSLDPIEIGEMRERAFQDCGFLCCKLFDGCENAFLLYYGDLREGQEEEKGPPDGKDPLA